MYPRIPLGSAEHTLGTIVLEAKIFVTGVFWNIYGQNPKTNSVQSPQNVHCQTITELHAHSHYHVCMSANNVTSKFLLL